MRIVLINLILISGILPCAASGGAYYRGKLVLAKTDTVYLIDETNGSYEDIYKDNPVSLFERRISFSASGRYCVIPIALNYSETDSCSEDSSAYMALMVLDLNNRILNCICGVADYDWAPDVDKFVYLLENNDDTDREPDVGDGWFSGKSIRLFDPASSRSTELDINANTIQSLCWSEYDGEIYVRIYDGVIQYDPVTKACKDVPYQSVYISPDGKYCFRESIDDHCGLYLTADQSEIPIISARTDRPPILYSDFIAWGVIDGNTVVYTIYDFFGYIDCTTGKLYEVKPPSPEIDPKKDLVGFKDGRPVWARIAGGKAELFYY